MLRKQDRVSLRGYEASMLTSFLLLQFELTKLQEEAKLVANIKSELVSERLMRTGLQSRCDSMSAELHRARAKVRAQEQELELMCEDLGGTEHKLKSACSRVELLEAEVASHRREREEEEKVLAGIVETQTQAEQNVKTLEASLRGRAGCMHDLQCRHQCSQARAKHLEEALEASNKTILELHAQKNESEADCTELRLRMTEAVHALESARELNASLEKEFSQVQRQSETSAAALKHSQHYLFESVYALSRISDVACGHSTSLGEVRFDAGDHKVTNQADLGPALAGQDISKQATRVCRAIHDMRGQLGTLQDEKARLTFQMSRRVEVEASVFAAVSGCVAEMESICGELQSERLCVGWLASSFEELRDENRSMEKSLLHAIGELGKSGDSLSSCSTLIEDALQVKNGEVERLRAALVSEKREKAKSQSQLGDAGNSLKKLRLENEVCTRQTGQWKDKYEEQRMGHEAALVALDGLRKDVASREENLDESKNLIVQMHRAVCCKFKKAGMQIVYIRC